MLLVFNCILLHRSDFPTLSLCLSDVNFSELSGVNRVIVPFLACGDLSAYDSDMTYPLEVHICLHCITLYWIVKNVVMISILVALRPGKQCCSELLLAVVIEPVGLQLHDVGLSGCQVNRMMSSERKEAPCGATEAVLLTSLPQPHITSQHTDTSSNWNLTKCSYRATPTNVNFLARLGVYWIRTSEDSALEWP